MPVEVAEVLIVGAGLAGLMAAQRLQAHGLRVQLVDKGSRVGGRLATRQIGPGWADHGAQFFTVRSETFQADVDRWLALGLVYSWSTGWSDGSLTGGTVSDGYPRYAVRGGMNALAAHLAEGLEAVVAERLLKVERTKRGWTATSEGGRSYTGRALLLTPPVPQALALLDAGDTRLPAPDRAALERIVYAPCVAGLFWVEGSVRLPEPGAVQQPGTPISWIADNQRKGISPQARLITVHASPDYSRELWTQSVAATLAALQAGLSPYLGPESTIREAQLKRWRYALPTICHPERYLRADLEPSLLFAGDAFGGPRVEGAALSGLAAAEALLERGRLGD